MRKPTICLGLLYGMACWAADDHWPRWRGPFDNGMARGDAPAEFSDTKNIAWKTAIPGRGHSTPIIWGDRIFLTTAVPTGKPVETSAAPPPPPGEGPGGPGGPGPGPGRVGPGGPGGPGTGRGRGPGGPGPKRGGPGGGAGGGAGAGQEHRLVVLCLDRKTGKVLWEQTAKVATPHEGYHGRYGSFASGSPATDGKRLYAFFGSRGLYCYDLNGNLIWQKDFPPMKIKLGFGEGAAPVLDGNRVIVNYDHEDGSFILALDKNNGKELWRTPRDEATAWSTPLIVEHQGRRQIVTTASAKVRSYEFDTGKLVWECAGLGGNVIPAPVAHGGIVYAMSGFRDPNLLAIRLGRQGDLTGTDAIAWNNTRGNSYTSSPVLHENKLYLISDNGMLSCLNATTGEPYYLQQRLPKPYSVKASPVGAGGKLFLATENGDVVVVKMGEKYEVVAANTLADQTFISSPVVADGSLYLRSQQALYCVRQ